MQDQLQFSENLRIARKRKKLSQAELAKATSCSAQAISNYENGTKIPSIAIAAKLARALEVSLDWLVGVINYAPVQLDAYLNKGDWADALCKLELDGAIASVDGNGKLLQITDDDLSHFWATHNAIHQLHGSKSIDYAVAKDLISALIVRLREKDVPQTGGVESAYSILDHLDPIEDQ